VLTFTGVDGGEVMTVSGPGRRTRPSAGDSVVDGRDRRITGVGKGTLLRRFGDQAELAAALLGHEERALRTRGVAIVVAGCW
jgi:hypothetical protein